MKITHISTSDIKGGAARAAHRLHLGLRAEGQTSRMLVGYKDSSDPEIASVLTSAPLARTIMHRVVYGLGERLSLQNVAPWPRTYLHHPFVRDADVVNLHHIHGNAFPYTILPALTKDRPAVWTLHDMWALTGHCSYTYDCERWQTGCGKCPRLDEPVALRRDTTAFHWRLKNRTYGNSHLRIVTPSRWLTDAARKSPLLGRFDVRHIPYGVDTEVFRPLPKPLARQFLGLPTDKPLVLFAADNIAEKRKGVDAFRQAIDRLSQGAAEIVTFGQNSGQVQVRGVKTWDLGVINDDRLIAAAYAASDVFVSTSLADNLPNTILESLACGTPIAAFDAGGVGDMVRHMETGFLARSHDIADLAQGLIQLLSNSELCQRLSARAREVAVGEYSQDLQATRYMELYEELVREPSPRHAAQPSLARESASSI